MAPSVTPSRTGVCIHRSRIHARCRIDRIFINHHWRHRYNDRPANHDGLRNDGSRFLDNNRRPPESLAPPASTAPAAFAMAISYGPASGVVS